jgi:hypothetical protein
MSGAEGERVGKRGDEGGEVKVKSVEERREEKNCEGEYRYHELIQLIKSI